MTSAITGEGNWLTSYLHCRMVSIPLTFRAWDVMNNSSTVTLDFNVDSSLSPDLINLTCTNNPAREQTTFIMRYDRPGTECSFMLEVFDFCRTQAMDAYGRGDVGRRNLPSELEFDDIYRHAAFYRSLFISGYRVYTGQ